MGGAQLFLVAIHLALGGFTSSAYVLIYTLTPLLVYPPWTIRAMASTGSVRAPSRY